VSRTVVYAGGWSEHRHVGDDAILRAHLDELARLAPTATPVVLGPGPAVLAERFGVAAEMGLSPLLWRGLELGGPGEQRALVARTARLVAVARAGRAPRDPLLAACLRRIAGARAVVVAGAGAMTSKLRGVGLWPAVATVLVARALRVPVAVSGITPGPLQGAPDAAAMLAALRAAELVTLRDRSWSPAVLHRLGVRARATPDDAAWLVPAPGPAATSVDRPYALLTLSLTTPPRPVAAIADALAARGVRPVGVPMDFGPADDDVARLRTAARLSAAGLQVLDEPPADAALRALAARAALVAGGRYHGAVFAALAGTPALLLYEGAYQRRKAEGLARLAGPVVRTLHTAAPPQGAALAAVVQAGHPRGRAHVPDGPLPAAAWAAAHALR
jgi:polysaccharide pyruvyl transferase WcaK-like protein